MKAPLESLRGFDRKVIAAREQAGVPGFTCAVLYADRAMSAAAGVLNLDTQVEARPDSLFQIGSITKSLTATLVMQAWDEGLLDIDAPVREYLRVRIGRGPFADTFTARQLMCHTSGLESDFFVDSGRNEDALAKYMVLCSALEFMAPPGRHYSYSNAGYAVLGRLVERVRGRTYDQVLEEHLFERAGLRRSTTRPEVAAFRRTAVGHGPGSDGKLAVVPDIPLPRSLGPAGLTLYSTADDLISYARAHLSGDKLLSLRAAEAMRSAHVPLAEAAHWGLGWKIIPRGDTTFVGHDGGTIGMVASLWTVPEKRLAIAMCGNGGHVRQAWEAVAFPIFREVCGKVPEACPPEYVPAPRDLSLYEGTYESVGVSMRVSATATGLTIAVKQRYFSQPDVTLIMRSVGNDRFRTRVGDDDKVITAFLDPDAHGYPSLFYAGRIYRRVGTRP